MKRPGVLVALAASGLLLAGCTPAPDLPPPMTYAEAKKRVYEQNLEWWNSMFPDEPMPEIEPIEFLDPLNPGTAGLQCLADAQLEGVVVDIETKSWSYEGNADRTALDRLQFTCALQYPYDVSDPEKIGYLSDEQLSWIWDYNRTRLVPCLRMLGFTVADRDYDYFGSGEYWIPYYEMSPIPTAVQWPWIDTRCPPSPVGPLYRPTSG